MTTDKAKTITGVVLSLAIVGTLIGMVMSMQSHGLLW